eukprot:5230926-Pleurochrysis_carterae.AAC.3
MKLALALPAISSVPGQSLIHAWSVPPSTVPLHLALHHGAPTLKLKPHQREVAFQRTLERRRAGVASAVPAQVE